MTRAIRPIPGITIAIALSLLVAGCAGIPNPIVTPVPHDALHPNATVAIGPTQAPDPVKLDEVGRQRAIWERLGIRTYRLGLLFGCHCDLGGHSVEALVVDGKVDELSMDGNVLDDHERLDYPLTVDELFDYAARMANAGKLELKYDEHLGYPLAVGVDPDVEARDDSVRIVVTRLVPGR